jgi:hypothetical protein
MSIKRTVYLIITFFHIVALLFILLVKLLSILVIFEWYIWRAKRSFEKQFMSYGVSKESAKRISSFYYNAMRRNVKSMFRRSLGESPWMVRR